MANISIPNTFSRYFNTGQHNRTDLLLSTVNPELPFKRNAGKMVDLHRQNKAVEPAPIKTLIKIPGYSGNHPLVNQIGEYISQNLSGYIKMALVHGSMADGSTVPYSDFDGLLIIKDEVFASEKSLIDCAMAVSKAYSLMIAYDPLQHHGWFILRESDLKDLPTTYFPPILFDHAAVIGGEKVELAVNQQQQKGDFHHSLIRTTSSIIKKLDSNAILKNMFTLKAVLSEFMLLPSLYIETVTGKGIYKKDSFDTARQDFNPGLWSVMDDVSQVRMNWEYQPGWQIRDVPKLITPYLKKVQMRNSGPVPPAISAIFTPVFLDRMRNLASAISQAEA